MNLLFTGSGYAYIISVISTSETLNNGMHHKLDNQSL